MVQRRRKGVQIGARFGTAAFDLFQGRILERIAEETGRITGLGAFGKAEIKQHHLAFGGHFQVLRLDIAVQHRRLTAMQIIERGEQLIGPLKYIGNGKWAAVPAEQRTQIGAAEKLHHQEIALGVAEIIDHLWQSRMAQRGQNAGLVSKGVDIFGPAAEHLFERNRITQALIDRLVHGSHTTTTDQSHNLIALMHQRAGLKHCAPRGRVGAIRKAKPLRLL